MHDITLPMLNRIIRTNVDHTPTSTKISGPCADLKMDTLECLEAYGSLRGQKLCKDFLTDFHECHFAYRQHERVNLMKRERVKQVLRGERKFTETFDSIKPPRDAFQQGPFYN